MNSRVTRASSKTLDIPFSAPHQSAAHAFLGGAVKCPPISETRLPDVTYWQVAQERTANGIARDIEGTSEAPPSPLSLSRGREGRKEGRRERNICARGRRGGRNGRRGLEAVGVICEDAPAVVITWDLRAPEGARGPYRGRLRRERDRQILIVIMGSDVPRSWHVYASRFEAALATRTAAQAESKSEPSQSSWLPGPSSSNRPFFPIDPSGVDGAAYISDEDVSDGCACCV